MIVRKAQSQRVVLKQESFDRFRKQRRVRQTVNLKQHRLVVVMQLGLIEFKETRLHRRKRNAAGYQSLLGHCNGGYSPRNRGQFGHRLMPKQLARR